MTAFYINAIIFHRRFDLMNHIVRNSEFVINGECWCIVISKMMMKADRLNELIFIVPSVWIISVWYGYLHHCFCIGYQGLICVALNTMHFCVYTRLYV